MALLLCLCVLLLLDSCVSHTLFTCEPVQVQWCLDMPYNTTFFPNMLEHYDQDIAAVRMKEFMPLVSVRCSPDAHLFLCQAFVPECRTHTHSQTHTHVLRPCRERCERVRSDCRAVMHTFDISWPSELQCERLESCGGSAVDVTTAGRSGAGSSPRDLGFWCPLQLKLRPGQSGSFLGAPDCAPPCENMFLTAAEQHLARLFIGVCSVVCLCATLFTFLTFLMDAQRFRYPERPIVFISVCYCAVSLLYLLGFMLGPSVACGAPGRPGGVWTVVLGARSRGCSLLFTLLYFCSTAGMLWWVILTITWFLAAGPKWSCEAIQKQALWFHAAGWGVPAVLTLLLLALGKVEGDGISGVCFTGLYDLTALRWFLVAPLALAVLLGLALLLAGIVALNRVRQVIQHDQLNQQKLKRFMIRIGVFSGLYLLPLLLLLGCYLYEMTQRRVWESSWVNRHCQEFSIPCARTSSGGVQHPGLSLFLLKYLMTLAVGIPAVFWVSSRKTCSRWASFCRRAHKKDAVSESRRVLQESCEFFLKHNSRPQQSRSSLRLKVLSKSMGTSTGTPASCAPPPAASLDHTAASSDTDRHSRADASSRISSRSTSKGDKPKAPPTSPTANEMSG